MSMKNKGFRFAVLAFGISCLLLLVVVTITWKLAYDRGLDKGYREGLVQALAIVGLKKMEIGSRYADRLRPNDQSPTLTVVAPMLEAAQTEMHRFRNGEGTEDEMSNAVKNGIEDLVRFLEEALVQ